MNYIDIIILIFLVWGAIRGYLKGLILEVTTLIGLVLGGYFAIEYSTYTEGILIDFFNISSRYITYVALGITFMLVALVTFIIGKLLTRFVNFILLGLINKLFGSVFGIIKYMLIVLVLLLLVNALNEKFQFLAEETRQESLLYQPFLNFAQKIYNSIRF